MACTLLFVKHCGIHREDRAVKTDIQSGVRRQYDTAEPLCGAAFSGTSSSFPEKKRICTVIVLLQYKWVQQKHYRVCRVLERCHFCSSYNHTIKNDVWFFFFHLKWGLYLARLCLGLTSVWEIPPVMCHLASCTSAGSIPLLVSSQPAVIKCALKVFRMGAKAKPLFPSDNDTIVFTRQWPSARWSHNSLIILLYCFSLPYQVRTSQARCGCCALVRCWLYLFFLDIHCWKLLQKHRLSKQSADCTLLTYHLFITGATDYKLSTRPPQRSKWSTSHQCLPSVFIRSRFRS